jgi:hypothetical protein
VTLADLLASIWAIGSVGGLWPRLLPRLGLGPWQAAGAALAIPAAAGVAGAGGLSVGAALWPVALGAALCWRLDGDGRRRALEAAVLAGLVLVLVRALAEAPASALGAALAGLCAAAVAGGEGAAAAGALLGPAGMTILSRSAAATAAWGRQGGDDVMLAAATALTAAAAARAALGRLRAWRGGIGVERW